MATNNNLTEFLTDVADAIREKEGSSELINPQEFSAKIRAFELGGGGGSVKPKWTGHADADGLRAIGWTDEDIAYYQENGVNWNEEDDQYHLVTDVNKAFYGVVTADNLQYYTNRIVYLPKIDTSAKTSMQSMFSNCYLLVAIPQLDTAKVTNMQDMFYNCYSLKSVPQLDTAKVTNMKTMFYNCYSLTSIPHLDTSIVTSMQAMFYNCYALTSIPLLDTAKVTDMGNMFYNCYSLTSIPQLDTASVRSVQSMFYNCHALTSIPQLDTASVNNISSMFTKCYSLIHANLKNAKLAYQLNDSSLLSKESLLYLINNEAATSAITIRLTSSAYTRLSNDADIVAALAEHPNISISK